MSKFEEFLQEINILPVEIRRALVLMRQLDVKKDGKSVIRLVFRAVKRQQSCGQSLFLGTAEAQERQRP